MIPKVERSPAEQFGDAEHDQGTGQTKSSESH